MQNLTSRPLHPLLRGLIILLIFAALVFFGWVYLPGLFSSAAGDAPSAPSGAGAIQLNIADGAILDTDVLNLVGLTDPEDQILINGQVVPVQENGAFELTLRLAEGPNLIVVEAVDPDGSRTSLTRQITYALPGAEPTPTPTANANPELPAGLLILAVGVILLAILIAVLRRRRPWINLTADLEEIEPGPKGIGPAITIVLELDRTSRISMFILNAGGKPVSTLLNNRSRAAGRHTFTWDGYIAGELVAAGKYTVTAEAGVPPFRSSARIDIQVRPNLRLT